MGRLIDADRLKDVLEYCILCNIPADVMNTKEEELNAWVQKVIDREPIIEAISKADYENRLKADIVAMLTEIQLEIEEQSLTHSEDNILSEWGLGYNHSVERCGEIIQQKIDKLKADRSENG